MKPETGSCSTDRPVLQSREAEMNTDPVTPMVAIEAISLHRARRPLFNDFSVSLSERRIGLVGDNGSGKSSLLRLIHGLLKPEAGKIKTLGLDTQTHANRIPARVGFLFQNPDHQILFPTIAEEIGFGLLNRGLSQAETKERVEAILNSYGCGDWGGRSVDELSGGQKQLVCLMAVMVLEPDLLLLDEPFASLDLTTRLAFIRRLRDLSPKAIIASHDFDLLQDCDRVIWLEKGTIRADGMAADILPAYREAAFTRAELY